MAFQATNTRIHFQPVVVNFFPNKPSRFHTRNARFAWATIPRKRAGEAWSELSASFCIILLSELLFIICHSATLIFEIHLESDLGFKYSKVRHADAYELLERNLATEIFKIQSPARCFEPELKLSVTNYQGCRQVSAWSRRIMLRLVILTLTLLLYDDDDPLAVSWPITSQLFG